MSKSMFITESGSGYMRMLEIGAQCNVITH